MKNKLEQGNGEGMDKVSNQEVLANKIKNKLSHLMERWKNMNDKEKEMFRKYYGKSMLIEKFNDEEESLETHVISSEIKEVPEMTMDNIDSVGGSMKKISIIKMAEQGIVVKFGDLDKAGIIIRSGTELFNDLMDSTHEELTFFSNVLARGKK